VTIQGMHKRMVWFQMLIILTLHGHNIHSQQLELPKFLMRYQQFTSHAYCGAARPVSKMASQQEKAFCVLRVEVSRSVITVQREFRAWFKRHMMHCNHKSGHLKMEHTESLLLLRRHLGNWSHSPAVSMRSELLVAHGKRGQLPLLTVYVVPV
jgi:hypothetical protein